MIIYMPIKIRITISHWEANVTIFLIPSKYFDANLYKSNPTCFLWVNQRYISLIQFPFFHCHVRTPCQDSIFLLPTVSLETKCVPTHNIILTVVGAQSDNVASSHRLCSLGRDALPWRYNERGGVWNHQPYDCLLNRLFRHRWKKTSKLRVTGHGAGNSPVTGEFPHTIGQ